LPASDGVNSSGFVAETWDLRLTEHRRLVQALATAILGLATARGTGGFVLDATSARMTFIVSGFGVLTTTVLISVMLLRVARRI
jgi:hypothetical protein